MKQLHISKQITIRDVESINKYLGEISKFDLISAEREVELAILIKKGDQMALNELTNANLRFVVSVAKQYQNQGLPLPDLINEGNLGLLKAAKGFDETRGFKFISYAVWWIRQGIIQAIANNSRVVRLPLNKINTLTKIRKSFAFFEQKYNRLPTIAELSEMIEVSHEEIELCLKNSEFSMSMNTPISKDFDANMYNFIENKEFGAPDKNLLDHSLKIDLEITLNSLSEREADIIKLNFGIGGQSSMTLAEIGQSLNITKERVRQIKFIALKKLKKYDSSNLLLKYL